MSASRDRSRASCRATIPPWNTTPTVRAQFGSDDIGVVGVLTADLFSATKLTKIARVTDRLAAIEGVERVLSLTNTVDPAADVFDPPKLLPHIPPSLRGDRGVEGQARRHAALCQEPGRARLPRRRDQRRLPQPHRRASTPTSRIDRADRRDPGQRNRAGAVLLHRRLAREAGGGSSSCGATCSVSRRSALVCVLLILWFSFRRVRAVVLPLITVVIARGVDARRHGAGGQVDLTRHRHVAAAAAGHRQRPGHARHRRVLRAGHGRHERRRER